MMVPLPENSTIKGRLALLLDRGYNAAEALGEPLRLITPAERFRLTSKRHRMGTAPHLPQECGQCIVNRILIGQIHDGCASDFH